MLPPLTYALAILFLTAALVSAIIAAADQVYYPQKTRVMNWVWPLTMLYLGPVGLAVYFLYGRNKPSLGRWFRRKKTPLWVRVLKGAMHCGAGCALGAFVAEWACYAAGVPVEGAFVIAFALAYLCGLLFQILAHISLRKLNWEKIIEVARNKSLPLLAYEAGMFSWMAITQWIFPDIDVASWDYWFMMQVAMLLGLVTTYPVNWALVKSGIKEAV